MTTIKLVPPKGYAALKPLHGSTRRPIRCSLSPHNWYYDLTDDHQLSQDPESLLVWLCDDCARELEGCDLVQFAGSDAVCDVACWQCDKPIERTGR